MADDLDDINLSRDSGTGQNDQGMTNPREDDLANMGFEEEDDLDLGNPS